MSTRVLVVDDTAVFRRLVTSSLEGVPGVEVVGTAANGKLALARSAELRPDLITLDIEMPEMNGIEVLEHLKPAGLNPGVVVLSSVTRKGGQLTMRALELGAFDFITKPEGKAADSSAALRASLTRIIQAFERRREIQGILRGGQPLRTTAAAVPRPPERPAPALRKGSPMVLIGVSTGGPAALAKVLPDLPADLGAPVLIVQHLPALFTGPLAERLQAKSAIRVKEAEDGEIAAINCAYIAPGGKQMKVQPGAQGSAVLRITDDAPENNCKPAVDYLFRSVALQFPGRSIAAILTGMGRDGTEGLRMLKRSGCFAIAQDEASCVVFGMPKEAILAGAVDAVLPLDMIGAALVRGVRGADA